MLLAQRASAPVYRKKRGAFATGGTVDVNVTPSSAAQSPTIAANSAVPAPTAVTDASNAAGDTSPPLALPTPIAQPTPASQPFSSAVGTVPTSALSGGQAGYNAIAPVTSQGIPLGQPGTPTTIPNSSAFGTAPAAPPPAATPLPAFLPAPSTSSSNSPVNATVPQTGSFTTTGPGNSVVQFGAQNPSQQFITGTNGNTPVQINNPYYVAPSTSTSPAASKRGGAIKKLASGGGTPNANEMMPYYARAEERGMLHPEGLVKSFGGGRTDIHPIDVPAGSYVVPADVTSGLAEGNTLAGSGVIDMMMHSNPYGVEGGKGRGGGDVGGPPKAHQGPLTVEAPPPASRGGSPKSLYGQSRVPIIVAGGEHIIYPQTIVKKFGDLKTGHAVLDKWVVNTRQQIVKDMKGLKGPKK